jgi:hypothetical protein
MFNLFSKYVPVTNKEPDVKHDDNVLNIDNWKLNAKDYKKIKNYFDFLKINIREHKYKKFIQDNFYFLLENYYLAKPEYNMNLGGLFCEKDFVIYDCINVDDLIRYIQTLNTIWSHKVSTLLWNIINCVLVDSTHAMWNKYKNVILNFHIGFIYKYKLLEKFLTE